MKFANGMTQELAIEILKLSPINKLKLAAELLEKDPSKGGRSVAAKLAELAAAEIEAGR